MKEDEKQFEDLSPEEQVRVFRETPISMKGDLLVRAHHPDGLTRAMSCEELYLVTREMDIEERSEVIKHATLPQLFFISDIDCWTKDTMNPKGFIQWLETLYEASPGKLLLWLAQMDYEAVVTGFKKFVEVMKPVWEYAADEVLGDRPYFTLDQQYYVLVEEENLQTVKRAIELIFEKDRKRYVILMEGLIGELEYEAEEEAYRLREVRLAERGFPDYETASRIYAPLSEEAFYSFDKKEASNDTRKDISEYPALALYPVLKSEERLFLDNALSLLENETPKIVEGVHEEMAWLSNKVITCDGIDFSSEKKVRRGVDRAHSWLNAGIEVLSKGSLEEAAVILKERWIEAVFRHTYYLLHQLKADVKQLSEKLSGGAYADLLVFLDYPYDVTVQGLLKPIPEFYDFRGENSFRDFKTEREIKSVEMSMRQLSAVAAFLKKRKLPPVAIKNNHKYEEYSLFKVMGAVFASFCLHKKIAADPLSRDDLKQFAKKFLSEKGSIHAASKEEFISECFKQTEQELLRPFFGLFFEALAVDLRAFQSLKAGEEIPEFSACLYTADSYKKTGQMAS